MKLILKSLLGIFLILITLYRCGEKSYKMGDLSAPSNLVLTAEILGANTANPAGDGSGDVNITIKADNALSYKVDYDAGSPLDLVYLASGTVKHKYTMLGTNTYRITAVVYGKGGTSSTITKDVTVKSVFTPDPSIVTSLTGGASKTWVVDKSVPGHFGVGPWDPTSVVPVWWAAGVNEKVACCNCFYTTTFKFTSDPATHTYSLTVTNPDGAFTKTGSLSSIPGIPDSGSEGCYSYSGGTAPFSFVPSSSGVAASTPSTQTGIQLSGNATYIGYGSLQKEYEIMVLNDNYMYLRVQGLAGESGNAWYIKLKPL